jgi:hypothetical protein
MNRVLSNYIEWDARLRCYQIIHDGLRTSLYGMGTEQAQEQLSAFLGSIDSFHFCSKDGYVAVVSKIHVQRGGDYWRAAKRIDGKVRQRHVGKTASVTFKALENVIQRFAQGSPKEQARATERRQEQRMRGYRKRFDADGEQPQAESEQPRKRKLEDVLREKREQEAQAEAASQSERPRKRTREEALREQREKTAREQAERDRQAQEAAERERQERERAAQAERERQEHARQAEYEKAERKQPTYRFLWIESERAYCLIDDDFVMTDGYPFICHALDEQLHAMPVGMHNGVPFTFGSRQGYECTVYTFGPLVNNQRSCYALFRKGTVVRRLDLGSNDDLAFEGLEHAASSLEGEFTNASYRASRLRSWDAEYRTYVRGHERCKHQHRTYGFADFGMPSAQLDALKTMGFDAMPGAADLKRRYRDLAKKHHPDVGGDTDTMTKINAANDLLKKFVAA